MEERTFNRLIHSKSPYLLQHAHNPVDWYPWGEEALQRAEKEDKPIFLSIGYSTCHWCHVMAHESFEDTEVAHLLNEHFVSIKVDREERPDIDQIYMSACQLLTRRGGWPLSIFMTPAAKPFFAGTYFPKTNRMGMPGFIEILKQLIMVWENDRKRVENSSETITNALQPSSAPQNNHTSLDIRPLKLCFEQLSDTFDSNWGGFSVAPKFPLPHNLTFLLRWFKRSGDTSALHMVEKTLKEMRKGGIFDQIGLGFHRYSVDEKWFIPHFEKMLYDQALLALAYSEAFQVTRNKDFKQTAEEILTYVLRDLTSPDGGFYSAEDADSEGKEGEFYVWTMEEVKKHLPKDLGELFCRFYGITTSGNFEPGRNIPHITIDPEAFAKQEGIGLEELMKSIRHARTFLFDVREKRVHPLKDDKIITSWNGLMIAAFARGHQVLGDPAYATAAQKAAHFILDRLRTSEGKLLRRFRENDVAYPGYVEDYAFFVWGLIELYESTFELDYLEKAVNINEVMIDLFWDANGGGLFYTGKDNEPLIAPIKDVHDGALPSGNSVAALNMVRLSRMTGNVELEKKADHLFKTFSFNVFSNPLIATQLLQALDFALGPTQEIVVAGDLKNATTQTMIARIRKQFLPNMILLLASEGAYGERLKNLSPFVAPLIPCKQKTTVYVCEQFSCKKPITEVEELMSIFITAGDVRCTQSQ